MKTNIKIVIAFVLGLMISGITVYAVSANEITYNNTTVKDALDDLYDRDLKLEHFTNDCYAKGCSLTKTYTAETNVTVNVTLECGGFAGGTTQQTSQGYCTYSSNGTPIYNTVLTHNDGGFTYQRVLTYKLEAGQYLTVNVRSSDDLYWYAGYDMLVIKK